MQSRPSLIALNVFDGRARRVGRALDGDLTVTALRYQPLSPVVPAVTVADEITGPSAAADDEQGERDDRLREVPHAAVLVAAGDECKPGR